MKYLHTFAVFGSGYAIGEIAEHAAGANVGIGIIVAGLAGVAFTHYLVNRYC